MFYADYHDEAPPGRLGVCRLLNTVLSRIALFCLSLLHTRGSGCSLRREFKDHDVREKRALDLNFRIYFLTYFRIWLNFLEFSKVCRPRLLYTVQSNFAFKLFEFSSVPNFPRPKSTMTRAFNFSRFVFTLLHLLTFLI